MKTFILILFSPAELWKQLNPTSAEVTTTIHCIHTRHKLTNIVRHLIRPLPCMLFILKQELFSWQAKHKLINPVSFRHFNFPVSQKKKKKKNQDLNRIVIEKAKDVWWALECKIFVNACMPHCVGLDSELEDV